VNECTQSESAERKVFLWLRGLWNPKTVIGASRECAQFVQMRCSR